MKPSKTPLSEQVLTKMNWQCCNCCWCSWCISMLREDLKIKRNNQFHFSLCRAGKSFNTYSLVPIFCSVMFEISRFLDTAHLYTKELVLNCVTQGLSAAAQRALSALDPSPRLRPGGQRRSAVLASHIIHG